ncbi:hypothetical protein L6272_00885, partial [Microgenomates group bacterium]|nr:hypothetical protein [Microgenomates group bacterium]
IIDLATIKFPPKFKPKEQAIVYIPPQQIAGNHQHQRTEVFLAIGEQLEMIWIENNKKKQKMNPKGKLYLFKVTDKTPHAIINKSKTTPGVLFEFTDTTFKTPTVATKII